MKTTARHIHIHLPTRDRDADIEAGESGTNGAQRSDGKVGGVLVQVLPGDATSYYVAADGQGRACLYRSVESDGALDPGRVGTGNNGAFVGDARRRIISADASRARATLRSINEANRKAWAGR